jgi:putative transcriptional regulator
MITSVDNLVGSLLLATSVISDPNFRKAVVLIADHGSEGSLGLVLNRPATLPVDEAAPELASLVEPGTPIFLGGPVQPQAAIVLAEVDRPEIASKLVVDSIGLLPVDAALETADVRAAVRRARIFAGYAGWGPGQLEGELAESAWLVEPALPADVFAELPAHLWATILRRKGGSFQVLALMPWDPSTN